MIENLLISVISDDKPGIVETIAEAISASRGNWLDSRLAQFSGKFAGIIRVSVESEHLPDLENALTHLQTKHIWVKFEQITEQSKRAGEQKLSYVHVLGPDRKGIVRELSHAFAQQNINFANLDTRLSSMPYSGDPLFEATGALEIPADLDLTSLRETLDAIADTLALDISLSDTAFDMQP